VIIIAVILGTCFRYAYRKAKRRHAKFDDNAAESESNTEIQEQENKAEETQTDECSSCNLSEVKV
jgi:hypothetical protein